MIVLNVSATPYCLFTQDSRVQDRRVDGSEMREANLVVWQEVLGPYPKRTATKAADLNWLEEQFGDPHIQGVEFMRRPEAQVLLSATKQYQPLDTYMQADRDLLRVDSDFEDIFSSASRHDGMNPSRLLAVEYAFCMCAVKMQASPSAQANEGFLDEFRAAVEWLVQSASLSRTAQAYLKAKDVSENVAGAMTLIESLASSFDSGAECETSKVVRELMQKKQPRLGKPTLQVVRLTDEDDGKHVLKFLQQASSSTIVPLPAIRCGGSPTGAH